MTNHSHGLRLDRHQMRAFAQRLRDIHEWAAEALDDAICRDVAHGRSPVRSGERPLEFHLAASDTAADALGTLRAWTLHLARHGIAWPGEKRIGGYARHLDQHLTDLAKTDDAETALDEISDVHQRIMRVIDKPEIPAFVGPCQADTRQCDGIYARAGVREFSCRTCSLRIEVPTVRATTEDAMRDKLFTKAELRTALVHFTDRPPSRRTLDRWIEKRTLVDHGGKYRIDDALAIIAGRSA